jgi:hypothetical protein
MMRKIPLVLLAAAALCHSSVAQAQTAPPSAPAAPATPGLSLEERYIQCYGAALCPLQERLQIVQEETNQMNALFQRVFEACAAKNFQDCTDSQQADMDSWHSADYRAGQMMLSIEAQSLALKESAAGEASKPADAKKSLWDRLRGK